MPRTDTVILLKQENDTGMKPPSGIAMGASLEPRDMKVETEKQIGTDKGISSKQNKLIEEI